jgi:predicted nucleotidyltransferase component of viral defense system
MKWHDEVLDPSGHKAAARLAAACGRDFYLAGGTALALRLGHRVSLDLDLFSPSRKLDMPDRIGIKQKLAGAPLSVSEEKDGTCHLRLDKTHASLFYYPYPALAPADCWCGLKVAAVPDIAAMKLSAVLGRGSKKDFLDLYCIFRQHPAAQVFSWAERKFPEHEDFVMQAGKALVYFDDAEKEPLPRLLAPLAWREVKAYFQKEIPRYFRFR